MKHEIFTSRDNKYTKMKKNAGPCMRWLVLIPDLFLKHILNLNFLPHKV